MNQTLLLSEQIFNKNSERGIFLEPYLYNWDTINYGDDTSLSLLTGGSGNGGLSSLSQSSVQTATSSQTSSSTTEQLFFENNNYYNGANNIVNNNVTITNINVEQINNNTLSQTIFNWTLFNLTIKDNPDDYHDLITNDNTEEFTLWNQWRELSQDKAALVFFLFLFSFATVFGNTLVILAVIRERYLHTATNYFVTSLAVADCLVGLVVMPFSALYEVLEHTWFFGTDWCDIWRSLDVLFSTASILNLCVISLDRYWAITDPFTYPTRMSRKRAAMWIAVVWICSSAISFPAILWWRAVRIEEVPEFKCPFTEHLGYLIFSSTISFYLPLFVMVFTYYKIYRAAVVQTRSLKLGTKQVMMGSGELELTLRIHRGGTTRIPQARILDPQERRGTGDFRENNSSTPTEDEPLTAALHNNGLSRMAGGRVNSSNVVNATPGQKNFSLSRKLAKFAKEKKAAKTLGIVMGVFIVCWLPFFVVNLLSGFCLQCIYHEELVSAVVTWLGWINSSMNPVIYACWSRDFRR
ncbi:dopamine receptor 2-like [Chrysoperla carnea]|uniref:dopamine receptor 2-like n=1 Tax=Chrysoperla carnea TaxID=189513 RepID=UPI001D071170|nr:dopamine receptor 2-like [Chrysoperla carnea]